MGLIVWQGREYPSGVLPSENVIQEILWELSFIHKLQSLDHHACHNLDLSDATQLFDRQIEISQCFHMSSFWHVPIPSENCRLADNDFDKHFGFVTGLVVFIMNSWKGDKPAVLAGNSSKLELSPDAAMELEEVVANITVNNFSTISDVQLMSLTTSMQWTITNFDYASLFVVFFFYNCNILFCLWLGWWLGSNLVSFIYFCCFHLSTDGLVAR